MHQLGTEEGTQAAAADCRGSCPVLGPDKMVSPNQSETAMCQLHNCMLTGLNLVEMLV